VTAGLAQAPGIVINEVLTHTDPPLYDSIELHNPTASAINIGGWYLSDSGARFKKYRIPTGTTLAAGGYISFNEANHFNTSSGANTNDFGLDAAHGDDVWLLQANAQSNLVAFVDHVDFDAARNGESFGRWPNSQGNCIRCSRARLGQPIPARASARSSSASSCINPPPAIPRWSSWKSSTPARPRKTSPTGNFRRG
jgi:hypothetical protein